MKQIDKLLIQSFVPPFIVTFMIAMFVLLMQILWLYIDDIAGKGLGLFLLVELMAYKSVTLIPMALPLAILISSVMVLGNLAERYELASFKSAGVPLWRIMLPMMFFAGGASLFSYYSSNSLEPIANLKFGSRMYDIQRQKPALRLDPGVFNDDFDGYAIHIGQKETDNRSIGDILIYDHADATQGRLSQIMAQDGEMFLAGEGKYFIMNLRDGHQYIETKPSGYGKDANYPFIRTNFKSWQKVFDLGEFELNRTNEDLFKQNRSMLSTGQLRVAVDSISAKIEDRKASMHAGMASYFYFMRQDSSQLDSTAQVAKATYKENKPKPNRKKGTMIEKVRARYDNPSEVDSILSDLEKEQKLDQNKRINKKIADARRKSAGPKPIAQLNTDQLDTIQSFLQTFPTLDHARILGKAKTFARSLHNQSESATRTLDRMAESKVKHIYQLHTKYSMALVCFIFLFIGAPMGAIIRKGGFGYPILISIIFFMLFIVLTIFCRKIAESFVLPAAVAAWIPCAVLFPIGLFLTVKAMNDSKLVNVDRITAFFSKLFKKKQKTKVVPAQG
ncbi:MAG: LptF/LptG family permease [Bacteroidota bacterium]